MRSYPNDYERSEPKHNRTWFNRDSHRIALLRKRPMIDYPDSVN